MEHFSEQPWIDFVRGVSAAEVSREIGTHLDASCLKCQTALDAWSRVRKLATDEAAFTPPENLVRLVKLGFAGRTAAQQPRKWTLANLVFDSLAQPLLAGMRSGELNMWQIIYEAEGLTVDLSFGRRSKAKRVHLVGQVLDKREVRPWHNVTIDLTTEKDQVLGTTVANASGEFQMEFEAKEFLWLLIKAESHNTVWIPLTNLRQQ
jgi:hypothetical protein